MMAGSSWTRNLRGYVGLSLIWVTLFGIVMLFMRQPSAQPIEILPPPTEAPTPTPLPTPTPAPIHVDVAGAVQKPGVYELLPGSLVADAIMAAGGPSEDADLDRINKAVTVFDGMQVYVPIVAQPIPEVLLGSAVQDAKPATGHADPPSSSGPIDINTATVEALDTLPGIGPATAQRIIDDRPYGAIEDILRVKGIGPATFDKIKDLIVVH